MITDETLIKRREYNNNASKKFYNENKSKVLEYQRENYKKNKETIREYKKTWYLENKEALNQKHGEYYKGNFEKFLLSSLRTRAKKRGLDFDLKPGDLIFPEYCPVLGVRMERSKGKVSHTSPSVDRIDSTKGYTKDNVQVISYKANAMKSNATQEELEMFARWVLKEKT